LENEYFLDDAREYARDGWTFTEIDLKDELDDPDDEDTLEDVRDYLGNGYTLTEQDLKDEMTESEADDLDDVRGHINSARTWLWVWWIVPVLLLIGIGFLGGRSWKGRSLWALGVLFAVSLIVLIATMMTYSNAVKPEVEAAIELGDKEGLDLVMAQKLNQIVENSADDFASGMQSDAWWFVTLSGVALVGIVGWMLYQRHRGNNSPSGDSIDLNRLELSPPDSEPNLSDTKTDLDRMNG